MDIAADFLARLAAHEIVDGHTQTLALDVPQGNIDRRERALHHGSHEVGRAIEELVVVLDVMRVLAEQVGGHDLDHRLGRTLPAMHPALTDADRAIFAMDANEQPAVPQEGFDMLNFGGF